MSTATIEKVLLYYGIRNTGSLTTGEKTKRAYLEQKEIVNLMRLGKIMSGDHGRMAGREDHVRSSAVAICESIHDELAKGNTVLIDDYLRFTPTLRKKVDPETGRPTEESELGVAVQVLRKMKLDIKEFQLVDRDKDSVEPKFTEAYTVQLGAVRDQIVRGKEFRLCGRNLYFDAAMGDTVTLSYVDEGEAQSFTITPTECDPSGLRFAFPAALAEVPDGTELEATLRTRMGVKDGVFSTTSRKIILVAA